MDTFGNTSSVFASPNKDKYLHGIFYFVFTVFWVLFFRSWPRIKKPLLAGFMFAVLYGATVEVCQELFTTGRSGDVLDALANTAGAALAILLLKLLSNKK